MTATPQQLAYQRVIERAASTSGRDKDYCDFLLAILAPKVVSESWHPIDLVQVAKIEGSALPHERLAIEGQTESDPVATFAFRNAQVLGHGGFVADGGSVDEFMFTGQPNWRTIGIAPVLAKEMAIAHWDVEADRLYLDPAPAEGASVPVGFWLGGPYAISNFGHFVHDLLTQVVFIDDLRRRGIRPKFIVTAYHAPKFRYEMQEFLFTELIGPLEEVIFHRSGTLCVDTLYAGSPVFLLRAKTGTVSRFALRYMANRIRDHFKAAGTKGGSKKIYITRDDGVLARQMENEPEARALLLERGFVAATISRYSPQEIVELFYDAEVIVGVHGAGLMNMVFCDLDRLKVVELDTAPSSWNSIMSFATGLGIDITRVPATAGTAENTLGHIDIPRMIAALDHVRDMQAT